ncbi:MAG: ferritin family protein [Syntrophaceae bacterium]|nr:ferritin family protein [Syntrophaceae bacterium]
MAENLTVHGALEMAIREEIKAYTLYSNLSERVKNSGTKTMLIELAEQEKGHQKLLEEITQCGVQNQLGQNISAESSGIANFMIETKLKEDATSQEVMAYAIKAEEKAFDFYTALADDLSDPSLKDLFSKLASEEKGHGIKLEDEYEEHFMRDN